MSHIKKVSTAVAMCMGIAGFHVANADIQLSILGGVSANENVSIGATAQSESEKYIDSSNWDQVPPQGSWLASGSKYVYTLHNQSGTSAHTLVAEIGLNFYSVGGNRANTLLGTCYLVASNADDANNDYSASLLSTPVGYVDSSNHYVPIVEEYGPSQLNTCPYASASFSNSGGGGEPDINIIFYPRMPSFAKPPQMQATLITNKDVNGEPLYRVDIQSGVLSSAQLLTHFTFVPYYITYAPSYNFLPPVKILNTGNTNPYQYQVSNSDFYIEAPDVGAHPTIGGWEGLNYTTPDNTTWGGTTLPTTDPTATLNAKNFAINLIAPYGTNGSQSVVDPNGMNQVPLRVLICYAPGGVNAANCVLNYNAGSGGSNDHGPITPSYIISPDYHPELMYLYKQVYFDDLNKPAGQQLINNLQALPASGAGVAVTTIENYPGPYVQVPNIGGIAGNSYQNIDAQSSNQFNNNPSWYFLSTTQTGMMQIQPNLMINGVAVQSAISNNQGIFITPTNKPSITSGPSGHTIILNDGNSSVPVYNANLFDTENSAATYFDATNDFIVGIGEYSVVQSDDYGNFSESTTSPYYNTSMVFVNSDGSLTVPDSYLNKMYSASSNPFTVVDVLGDAVQVK